MPDTTPSRLQLRHETTEHGTTVHVAGELDPHSAPEMATHLAGLPAPATVVLDLEGLRFMDSSGLRVLLAAAAAQREVGGQLWLRSPSPAIQRLLDVAGVGDALPVRPA